MPNILVRNVSPVAVAALKARARRNQRTLQAELRSILEQTARVRPEVSRAVAARIRRRLAGRRHSDSTLLIAADRAR
jgi:plasmid stability protein